MNILNKYKWAIPRERTLIINIKAMADNPK